jgi:hypothetical protein
MSTGSEIVDGASDRSAATKSTGVDHLRMFLSARDVACPGCRYNLRDLSASRCPECGDELVLRVGLAEPRQAAMIAGLIGLSSGAGLFGLLLIYIVIRRYIVGDLGPPARFVIIIAACFIIQGLSLLIWLWRWRAIRRQPGAVKRFLVCACWLLTMADLLVFSLTIK